MAPISVNLDDLERTKHPPRRNKQKFWSPPEKLYCRLLNVGL